MKQAEQLYYSLKLIREFELAVAEIYPSDKIKSPVHLSIGQEFVSVAVCQGLQEDDYVAATYRGHAAYLAKGGCPKKLIAEMYGKSTGCAKGRGGSMHLIEPESRVIGTSAVVGTGIPVATGYALAQQLAGNQQVVVCFLGDGATEEGCFYESLNFAGLKKLPILYVVENNRYAIHEPLEKRWANTNLMPRVTGFGVSTHQYADGDVEELANLSHGIVEKIRGGAGPALLEVDCYRWYQHVGPDRDFDQGYRDQAEVKRWMDSDPVEKLAASLASERVTTIDSRVAEQVAAAVEFAEQSDFPDVEELFQYVYK